MGTTRRSVAVFGAFAAMFATSPGQTFVISNFNEPAGGSLDMAASTLTGAYLRGGVDCIGPRHMVSQSRVRAA